MALEFKVILSFTESLGLHETLSWSIVPSGGAILFCAGRELTGWGAEFYPFPVHMGRDKRA